MAAVVGAVDTITLDLEVWAEDTEATLIVVVDGVVRHVPAVPVPPPAAAPDQARRRWRARLEYDQPGVWHYEWLVTGTGEGTSPTHRVAVAAGPVGVDPRHTYATTGQLAHYLRPDPPPLDADRMLRDATQRVDDALLMAVYDVDTAGMPTDPEVAGTLRDAVCAVVAWWDANGWDGSGAEAQVQSASIAGVSLGFARGKGGRVDLLGDQARQILITAGLLGHGPYH